MVYITIRQKQKEEQLSWMDLIESETVYDCSSKGAAGTITRKYETVPEEFLNKINVQGMIDILKRFNKTHEDLFAAKRDTLYRHFSIPKKTGGLRPIDAPCDELKLALEELGLILSERFGVLYHTSAFAYIANRSTIQLVRKHQVNESNWFYKTDVSGFFPSTTLEFTMKMVKMIFPLSEICKDEEGYKELKKALSLGFLNGVLPQGTPLSPKLTNIISIPIDHRLFNELAAKHIVYTRYADDLHISCVQKFDPDKMTKYIEKVYKEFGAPWILKPEKTHFGNRKGHNGMLGVVLNAENNITTGYRNKKHFRGMTANLIMDYKNNKPWPVEDVMTYNGLLSYYKMVEKDYFESIVDHYNKKFNVDLKTILKRMMNP